MKTILFLGAMLFFFSTVNSQDLSFSIVEDTVVGTTDDWTLESHLSITNNSSTNSYSIQVYKKAIETVNECNYYFCWGPKCYTPNDSLSNVAQNIGPGETNTTFSAYLTNTTNTGISKVRYSFFDESDATDTLSIDVAFKVTLPSSLEESGDNFSVGHYPSPTHGTVSIVSNIGKLYGSSCRIELYSILGEKVAEKSLEEIGTTKIDISKLPSGMYFYSIYSTEEDVILTNRMLISTN